jgi:hypothetical protein
MGARLPVSDDRVFMYAWLGVPWAKQGSVRAPAHGIFLDRKFKFRPARPLELSRFPE